MSFSSPITSYPCDTKCLTDSEPIRPPDPVTMQTGLVIRSPNRLERLSERLLVRMNPVEDVFEDHARVASRAPVGPLEQARAIRDVNGNVARALAVCRGHLDLVTGDLGAQTRRFAQRERHV